MKLSIIIALIFFQLCNINAQITTSLDRANAYFEIGEYVSALEYYHSSKKKSVLTYFQMAKCYSQLGLISEAFEMISKMKKLNRNCTLQQELFYINLLKMKGLYLKIKEEGAANPKLFENELLSREISNVDSILRWNKFPSDYKIENLKDLNTKYAEISPVKFKESIVFSSNREGVFISKKSKRDRQPFYDLYVSKKNEQAKWKLPTLFFERLKETGYEMCASFTADGNKVYFSKIEERFTEKRHNLKLFSATRIDNDWTDFATFVFNEKPFSFTHPCVESNEKMFFFSSDMAGGYGGSDIYVCVNIEGKWTDPINLGSTINTPGNEIFPFYHENGNLYFSSNYHPGFGGYDIFMATQYNGDWNRVFNLKSPINSSMDDFSFYLEPNSKEGYFSSNRKGGKGKEDIYKFKK